MSTAFLTFWLFWPYLKFFVCIFCQFCSCCLLTKQGKRNVLCTCKETWPAKMLKMVREIFRLPLWRKWKYKYVWKTFIENKAKYNDRLQRLFYQTIKKFSWPLEETPVSNRLVKTMNEGFKIEKKFGCSKRPCQNKNSPRSKVDCLVLHYHIRHWQQLNLYKINMN